MKLLISAVGTRGDVQPAVALALQVRRAGAEAVLAVPPNFTGWARDLGFAAHPVGVEMRAPRPGEPVPPVPDLIADQFAAVGAAADGCSLIVAAGAHQYAARSIAEARGLGYVLAVYAPVAIPQSDLGPPGAPLGEGPEANGAAWARYRAGWNARSLARVNAGRATLGLPPLDDSLGHILGARPWLACDAVLGPAAPGLEVAQTGAWLLADETPLPPELEAFLAAGEPPLYAGFGSMPAAGEMARVVVEAARALGRRVVLSRGWAELAAIDEGPDCLAIGDVSHAALFPRVACVLHHGGAGTTTAAALAGAPQVVAAMFSDQFYWGSRVADLGIGATLPAAGLSVEALAPALAAALRPQVSQRARTLTGQIAPDGAAIAARRLLDAFG